MQRKTFVLRDECVLSQEALEVYFFDGIDEVNPFDRQGLMTF